MRRLTTIAKYSIFFAEALLKKEKHHHTNVILFLVLLKTFLDIEGQRQDTDLKSTMMNSSEQKERLM